MKTKNMAIIAILMATGCTSCDPKPADPCKSVVCENGGTCDNGTCKCAAHYYGDTCSLYFDPASGPMAYGQFCSTDSGKVELSGISGSFAIFNGSYVEIPSGAFDRCVWIQVWAILGVNITPVTGELIASSQGLDIKAIPQDDPVLPNGDPKEVQPIKEIGLHFKGWRGTVLYLNRDQNRFEDVPFSITAEGSLGSVTHLSTFFLSNHTPAIQASAARTSGTTVEADFSGTTDEASGTSWFLDFSVLEGGTPLALSSVADHKFQATLLAGSHTLTLKVADPYGKVAEKEVTVNVDLCVGDTACAGQHRVCVNGNPPTCGNCVGGYHDETGTCVIDQVCQSNSCSGHGTCDDSTGVIACACSHNWEPPTCFTCPADSYVDGNGDCVDDPCLPNPCGHGGTCSRPSDVAVCSCVNNWDPLASCNSCATGYQDNDNDGVCAPACSSGTCSGHGTCSDTSGTATCSCTGGWGGSDCSTLPPMPTVGNVAMACGGGCSTTLTYQVTFDSANADTYTVTLESQVGNPQPGTCVSKESPTTCTEDATSGGDEQKVHVHVCNAGGLQCADAWSATFPVG